MDTTEVHQESRSAGQSSSPDLTIPTRRIDFEEAMAELPRHFAADGDLVSSHIIASLSSVFPDGEDFFVRSVRHYRGEIVDPVLKRQVAGFIGQESMHGREHRIFNRRLDELGYPTLSSERITRRILKLRERILPPISNLAFTAALEHFTATLAELILQNPEVRDLMGEDAVRDLFVWHALEESEHKAVAFDVYKAVGGSERLRIFTMKATRYGFIVGMVIQVMLSLLGDRTTYRKGRLRGSLRVARQNPLFSRAVWDELCEYDRRGFHPNDRDNTALIAEWREILFGEEGSLNNLLSNP
ncbi:MAG: metal-dependent hydrolase, partial [Microthrixaceae bacterium]